MPVLLFTANRTFLGSLSVHKGACEDLSLNEQGTALLREDILLWKKKGIPTPRSVRTKDKDRETCHLTTEYTPLQSSRALFALEAWARFRDLTLLLVPDPLMVYWEGISTWPLEQQTRFQVLFGLLRTERRYLSNWNDLFEETQASFQALASSEPHAISQTIV